MWEFDLNFRPNVERLGRAGVEPAARAYRAGAPGRLARDHRGSAAGGVRRSGGSAAPISMGLRAALGFQVESLTVDDGAPVQTVTDLADLVEGLHG